MPRAGPGTTGRSSTGSSTPISSGGSGPTSRSASCPRRSPTKPEPYQHHWTPRGGAALHRLGLSAQGLRASGASWSSSGSTHCVARYGRAEVEQWYWEVWNEPNIFYWRGTPEEYHQLYDHAADAVKRALPTARVGGPEVAGTRTPEAARFLRDFLEHCLRGDELRHGQDGAPLDFIAFHAKGSPRIVEGHVQMGIGHPASGHRPGVRGRRRLSRAEGSADRHRRIRPRRLRGLPGDGLPPERLSQRHALRQLHRGRLSPARSTWPRSTASTSRARSPGRSSSRTSPISPGSACWPRNGIDLPVLNVFRMFGLMGGRRLAVESTADAGVEALRLHGVRGRARCHRPWPAWRIARWASWSGTTTTMTCRPATPRSSWTLRGLPVATAPVLLEHYRIDGDHSNAFEAWKRMGSPQQPTPEQLAALERSAQLETIASPRWHRVQAGALSLRFPCRARRSRWSPCGGDIGRAGNAGLEQNRVARESNN